ncbi:hypothetical protein PCAR4_20088 [Paraburkholderia caribensis]|nr:hypothetical protein PCAR4_20088 [Paraburkholderia caribensis]
MQTVQPFASFDLSRYAQTSPVRKQSIAEPHASLCGRPNVQTKLAAQPRVRTDSAA